MPARSTTPRKPIPSPFDSNMPANVNALPDPPAEGDTTTDPTVGQASQDAPQPESAVQSDGATPEEKPKRKYNRAVLKAVPVDELGESDDVPEEEWEQHPLTATTVERDPAQVVLDTEFKALLDTWVKAGRPDYRHSPRKRRVVSPEHAPAIRKMYAESAKLYDVAVKFAPASHDQHGREVIVYAPEKKIVRPRRGKDVTAPPASGTDTPESTPTAGDGALPGESKTDAPAE